MPVNLRIVTLCARHCYSSSCKVSQGVLGVCDLLLRKLRPQRASRPEPPGVVWSVSARPWSQGHRNRLIGVLTGVAEGASLLPAGMWLQLGGSGPGPEGGSPPVGRLALGDGVQVRNQTSGPTRGDVNTWLLCSCE